MIRWGIIFLLLAILEAGHALGDVAVIPASQDVYISMGGDKVSVYNQTDFLLCARAVAEENGTEAISFPGAPVIQFDLSQMDMTEDDVAVLVLKAEAMQATEEPVMVALMTIGSQWDESSDYTEFLVNILPAWDIIKDNDATAMSSNTDGDLTFAFDVSKKLLDSWDGGKISFLLEAVSNGSSEITFLSRESGSGPALLIMPYPATGRELGTAGSEAVGAMQDNATDEVAFQNRTDSGLNLSESPQIVASEIAANESEIQAVAAPAPAQEGGEAKLGLTV